MANAIPLHVKSLIQAVSTPACPASRGGCQGAPPFWAVRHNYEILISSFLGSRCVPKATRWLSARCIDKGCSEETGTAQAGAVQLQVALLQKRSRRLQVLARGDRTWQKKSCVWIKGAGRSSVTGVDGP